MSSSQRARLVEDTLYLACTRPALTFGVPMEAIAANVIATTVIFIVMGSIFYAALGIVFHFIAKEIVKHDYNAFRLLFAYVETKGRSLNASSWGGSSCTPLRLRRTYSEKDWL